MVTMFFRNQKYHRFLMILSLVLASSTVSAEAPGRGMTAEFEIDYLKSMIDHHYSALRITELAAGTDEQREAPIDPEEGTSPTPDTQAIEAKAGLDELKSLARINNRMQREEVLTAQRFLRQWYGMEHKPQVPEEAQAAIELLEQTPAGQEFDHIFMEVLSRHHYKALAPSLTCMVASDMQHEPLHRYCNGIVHAQVKDIKDMRELLSKHFDIHDYQPTAGIKGQHEGEEGTPSE